METLNGTTWELAIWVDSEPNSHWETIHRDHIGPDGITDPDEALDNAVDREDTPGDYRLSIRDAHGIELGHAETVVQPC